MTLDKGYIIECFFRNDALRHQQHEDALELLMNQYHEKNKQWKGGKRKKRKENCETY